MRIIRSIKRRLQYLKGRNLRLDRKAIPIPDNVLEENRGHRIVRFDRNSTEFWVWIKKCDLQEFQRYSYPHKKALEFFFSTQLLEIKNEDIVLDAAGGKSDYLITVNNFVHPSKLILQDHIYPVRMPRLSSEDGIKSKFYSEEGINAPFEHSNGVYNNTKEKNGILTIGGDVTEILLPEKSVDKISCHHAFEHFQENKDYLFVKEVSRLLKIGGKAVIIPLFISTSHIESWNTKKAEQFDKDAQLLIDETASLPGGDTDGHFARIYSPEALRIRILDRLNELGLAWTIVDCTLDGKNIPDMSLNVGAKINCPLRALVLTKNAK